MPVVEIHLVGDQQTPARAEELLRRVSERCAAVMATPIGRVRAFVTIHPPELWAVGGVPAAVDGDPAPYFVAAVLEGSPAAHRQRLLAELTDVVCDVLGATRSRVHGRVTEVRPGDWAVGGVPESSTRRGETVVRTTLV